MKMPAHLQQRARDVVYGGDWEPPPARPASTLVLLRDGAHGLQAALLQRSQSLAFAGGMYVFPGGALDPEDEALGDPWLVAAIRETFEECGVLLCVQNPTTDPASVRDRPFAQALAQLGVRPDFEALAPFAHWVTPEVESRRFDTRFYATVVPPDQDLGALTGEHQAIGWFRPSEALRLPMLPPTAAVLQELSNYATARQALAVTRAPVPIMPRPVATDGGGIAWVLVDARTGQPIA